MNRPIEPKILLLVDALNAIPGVSTIASCEGHFSRISRPYVYFHCPPRMAEIIAARLHDLSMQDMLHHWWHLAGCFNGEHRLCFSLEAPGLDHDRGFLKTFLNYIVFRKKIDDDLGVLSNALNKALKDAIDDRRENAGLIGSIEHKDCNNSDAQTNGGVTSLLSGDMPERIGFTAVGASALDVGRNSVPTMVARWRSNHNLSFPSSKTAWNLTHLSLTVVFLALTLSACAGNVELQKDGTGTDEMLPSPCACLPVPYEPQFYRWDLG